MIIINIIDSNKFEFNGLAYPRLFMAIAQGTTGLAIHNVHDVKQQLLGPTHFSDIQVDGITFANREDLMSALVPVLYVSEGSGGTSTDGSGTVITNINQIPYRSYNDLQDKPTFTGEVSVVNNNTNVQTFNIATINGTPIYETVTALNKPTLNGTVLSITLVNELMEEQMVTVDLASLISGTGGILNATFDQTTSQLIIQGKDSTEYSLDLSAFEVSGVLNPDGSVSIMQGGGVRATISKAGESGKFGDLLELPTTLAGYGITDAYTITQVDALLNDKVDTTGYNKVQWDQAVAWGDHNQAGYITSETVTKLNTPVLIGNILTLKFQNELGVEQTTQIDLSSLSVDSSNVVNGVYDPLTKVITLTDGEGGTQDIDLKQFIVHATTDGGGNKTLTQNAINLITVSKAGLTGDYSDLLNKPTIPTIPTNVSSFTNDSGYITGLSWSEVSDKPTEFTPIAHDHNTLYYTKNEVDTKLQGTTVEGHTHTVSDITDFPSIPDATSDLTNDSGFITGLSWSELSGKPTTFAPSAHTLDSHSNVSISGNTPGEILKWNGTAWVNNTLGQAGIAADGHTHNYNDLTNKPFIPDSTSDLTNDSGYITGVTWSEVTGKPTTFTPSTHTHSYNDLTDKPTDFAPQAHTHTVSDITDFPAIPDATSDLTNDSGFITGVTWEEVTGKPVTFAPDVHHHDDRYYTETEIDAKLADVAVGEHTHSYNELTDKPVIPTVPTNVSAFTNDAGYLSSVSWADVTEKPTDFAAEDHTHSYNELTDKPVIPTVPTNVSEFTNDAGYLTQADTTELTNQDNKMRVITCEINYIAQMNEEGFAQWINDNPITVAQDEVAILEFVYKQKEQYEIEIINPQNGDVISYGTTIDIELSITDTTTV